MASFFELRDSLLQAGVCAGVANDALDTMVYAMKMLLKDTPFSNPKCQKYLLMMNSNDRRKRRRAWRWLRRNVNGRS